MWSLGKQICCLMAVLCLSACGFQPLYAKKAPGDVSKVFAGVKIDSISGKDGQEMHTALEDKLNPDGSLPVNPAYRLTATLSNSTIPIGVARDGTISRYNIYLTSHYTLYRNSDGKAIAAGDISYVNSYNNQINEYFSTYVSQQDAIKRNIAELAELYRERLTAYLDQGAPEQAPKDIAESTHAPVAYTPVLFNQVPGITSTSVPPTHP